jgi:hypothetical protein
MRQPSAHSKDQTGYASEDKTGRVLIRSGLRRKVLALDNALVEVPFRANGDFLYADQLSTGVVTIKLNNTSEDPIPFSAQSMVEDWPIEDVLISCAAQPGLVLNLWYGWRGRIRPPQSVVSLTGNVQLALTTQAVPQGADAYSSNGFAYQGFNLCPAVAAQNSVIALQLNNGSPLKIYVDKIRVWSSVATQLQVTYEPIGHANANPSAAQKKDGSSAGGLNSFTINNLTSTGNPFDIYQFAANQSFDFDFGGAPLILPANKQLALTTTAVNTTLAAIFFFRQF